MLDLLRQSDVPIESIRIDGGTQSRVRIDPDTVADYADAMQGGAEFPPVIVYYDGNQYWLADGFHRLQAWVSAWPERTGIPAEVRQGDRREAVLHSVGANDAHGLRRTNEDKRRAVLRLLEDAEWGTWPDAQIAHAAAVGRHFVRKLRDEITCTPSTSEPVYRKYINKHGKESLMDVSRIGSARSKARSFTDDENALLVSATRPCVYVLDDGKRCKVGWSGSVSYRVAELLRQNPDATVVAVANGGEKEERAIHNELECERDTGEWFIASADEVFAVMDRLGITYTTKHGTTATMQTGNIGKRAEPVAPAPPPRGKLLVDWTDEDWAAHDAEINAAVQAAADAEPRGQVFATSEPKPYSPHAILPSGHSPTWNGARVEQPTPPTPAQGRPMMEVIRTEEEADADERGRAADEAVAMVQAEVDASEWPRLQWWHRVLAVAFSDLTQAAPTAESYGFGVETERLLAELRTLRDEVKRLTPGDRLR